MNRKKIFTLFAFMLILFMFTISCGDDTLNNATSSESSNSNDTTSTTITTDPLASSAELKSLTDGLGKIIFTGKNNYNFVYPVSETSISLSIETKNPKASYIVRRNSYNVSDKSPIDLHGDNCMIDILVTSADGTAKKVYRLSIHFNMKKSTTTNKDSSGNITSYLVYDYTYDDNGNMLKEIKTNKNASGTVISTSNTIYEYTYDSNKNILTKKNTSASPIETETYTYDSKGNELTCTKDDGGKTTSTYNSNGNLTYKKYENFWGNGIYEETNSYNSAGFLTNYQYDNIKDSASEFIYIETNKYTYDLNYNITEATYSNTHQIKATGKKSFVDANYDSRCNWIYEFRTDEDSSDTQEVEYEYDSHRNIQSSAFVSDNALLKITRNETYAYNSNYILTKKSITTTILSKSNNSTTVTSSETIYEFY